MKQLERKTLEFSEVIVDSPTTFVASMVQNAFVRITMVSSAPTMRASQSSYPKLFLKFGQWVICVSSIPKETPLETIVQDTLIALHAYLKYSATNVLDLSSSTLRTTVIHRIKTLIRISQKLPINTLLNETMLLMVSHIQFLPPFRFNIIYSPDVLDMTKALGTSFTYGIHSYLDWVMRLSERQDNTQIQFQK